MSHTKAYKVLQHPVCQTWITLLLCSRSICFHPSLLPRHRGASAISWTLIEGDTTGGFSIFYPDAGLDTGDLLLTRQCNVSVNDTVDTLYNNFMYPEGVKVVSVNIDVH